MDKAIQRIDDSMMTIKRKRWGSGYRYVNENGDYITDKKLKKRIKNLVIPPMWTDVSICKFDDGHIQATGRDTKGRKQYIYHQKWHQQQQALKFEKLKTLGLQLPEIREACYHDVQQKKWNLRKVCALIVLILDDTGIRIGNHAYTQRNETYGLTTLRRKHLDIENNTATFNFTGKRNISREVVIDDPELISSIRKTAQMTGYDIFRYRENGSYQTVDSSDVNAYIQKLAGPDFTSKDFRTWVASRYAIELYPIAVDKKSQFPRKKLANILIRSVAELLGNTPSVCRTYYIHPAILNAVETQEIPEVKAEQTDISNFALSPAEEVVLELI